MGGNCIKDAARMDKERYEYMCTKITQALNCPYLQNRGTKHFDFKIVDAYREKDSFGDIDVVIEVTTPDTRRKIEWALSHWPEFTFMTNNKVTMVPNGPVTSFGILGHQVDLIYEDEEHYNFACNYYSYNDICNLIGRITHKMGFKFGHDGLWYILRNGDYVVEEICITRDFNKALELFGFSSERFRQGFNNLLEIFEYITSNHYFNPDIYLLNNRNHTARVRDRKRKTYMAFLEHCEQQTFENPYQFKEDKDEYLQMVFSKFPRFRTAHFLAEYIDKMRIQAKAILSTDVIRKHTGLDGIELGNYIKATSNKFVKSYHWHMIVTSRTLEEVLQLMDDNYQEFLGEGQ